MAAAMNRPDQLRRLSLNGVPHRSGRPTLFCCQKYREYRKSIQTVVGVQLRYNRPLYFRYFWYFRQTKAKRGGSSEEAPARGATEEFTML
jgi:hypothetical protein